MQIERFPLMWQAATNSFRIPHNTLCLSSPPPQLPLKRLLKLLFFKCSWEYLILPGAFEDNSLCKICWGGGGGVSRGYYGVSKIENGTKRNGFFLTWEKGSIPTSTQDWNDSLTWPPFLCLGAPIWLPWRHVRTAYIRFHLTEWKKVRLWFQPIKTNIDDTMRQSKLAATSFKEL